MQSLILIGIVGFNGFIALSEMALISSRKVRLQRMVDEGRSGAKIALALSESPTRFLASMQICLTVLGIMAGVYGGATLADEIEQWVVRSIPVLAPWAHGVGMTAVIAFETFLMVFFGELLPKRLALIAPESIAVRVAPTMQRIGQTLSPAAHVLSRMTDGLLAKFPFKKSHDDHHSVTEDEFKMIVEQGAEEGVLDRNEETMIKRVLQFGDIKAEDLMTPRTKLIGLNIESSPQENIEIMFKSNNAFFPVYLGEIDNLVGIVSVKRVFENFYRTGSVDLKTCMNEPLFLPSSVHADRVLEAMKKNGTHIAVLIDKFGGMSGVVTATDIVEAVMGDVPQDSGDSAPKFVTRTDGSLLIDGMVSLNEIQENLNIDLSEMLGVVQTLSGLVMHIANDLPKEGHRIAFKNWTFEVVDMDGNRIDKILACLIPDGEVDSQEQILEDTSS